MTFYLSILLLFLFNLLNGAYHVDIDNETDVNLRKGLPHYPRTYRPPRPFGGLKELYDYNPKGRSKKERRSCSHEVNNNGFKLSYDVTIREGVHSIDTDDRIIHLDCNLEDSKIIHIISSDPVETMAILSNVNFIVGDQSWGCASGLYNDSRSEPVYRFLESYHLNISNNYIIARTAIASFYQLFESSTINLDIPPNFEIQQEKQYDNNHLNIETYEEKSYSFSYNYDKESKSAKAGRIPLTFKSGSLNVNIYCEQCFFNFNVGIKMNIIVGNTALGIPFQKLFEQILYGDAIISNYFRVTAPSAGASDELPLMDKYNFAPIIIPIFGIPLVIYPSFQMIAQLNVSQSSLPLTLFGGFTATAAITCGTTSSDSGTKQKIISNNNWTFQGTPLSSTDTSSTGIINTRLYFIPRIFLSPYGLVSFTFNLKPYIGLAIWDSISTTSPSNPEGGPNTIDDYNSLSVPTNLTLLSLNGLTTKSAVLNIPSYINPSQHSYQVRYYLNNDLFSFFYDYIYLNEMGMYSQIKGSCSSGNYKLQTLNADIASIVICAQLCLQYEYCNYFNFYEPDRNCYFYSTISATGSDCQFYSKQSTTFVVRDGDVLGYTATGSSSKTLSTVSINLDSYYFTPPTYAISYRYSNVKGFSSWSEDLVVGIKTTISASFSNNGNTVVQLTVGSNLLSGTDIQILVYQEGNFFNRGTLICTMTVTLYSSSQSASLVIGNFWPNVYTYFGNSDQELFFEIKYGAKEWASIGDIKYYPVSSVTRKSFTSTSTSYQFYANPNQIKSVKITITQPYQSFSCYVLLGTCYNTISETTIMLTSANCISNLCQITATYPTLAPGIKYCSNLKATDQGNIEVLINDNSCLDSVMSTTINRYLINDGELKDNPIKNDNNHDVDLLVNKEIESTTSTTSWLVGHDKCAPNTPNGYNYAFYVGLDLQLTLEEISFLGIVLVERKVSPVIKIISPFILPDMLYATGCLKLQVIPAQIVVTSPILTDKWGLNSTVHYVEWEYYSIPTNAMVTICFSAKQNLNYKFLCKTVAIDKLSYNFFIDSRYFEIGSFYRVTISYSSLVSGNSDFFYITDSSNDFATGELINLKNQTYDDRFKTNGTIFSSSLFSIFLKYGSGCQAKVKTFPLNVYCSLIIGINTNKNEIYKFTINLGATVNSITSLINDGFVLGYGLHFQTFKFPNSFSGLNYFFKSIGNATLASEAHFPSDKHDLMQLKMGSLKKVCLTTLLNLMSSRQDVNSNTLNAANKVSEFIDLLGVDACLDIYPYEIDKKNGGIALNISVSTSAFDVSAINWGKYLGMIKNKYFQKFLKLSGTTSTKACAAAFSMILNALSLKNKVSWSKSIGTVFNSLLQKKNKRSRSLQSSQRFINNNGMFVLGSLATETIATPSTTTIIAPVSPSSTPITIPVPTPVPVPVSPIAATYSTGFSYSSYFSNSQCTTGSVVRIEGNYNGNCDIYGIFPIKIYYKALIDTATCDTQYSYYSDSACTISTISSSVSPGSKSSCRQLSSGLYSMDGLCGTGVQSVKAPSCTLTRYTDSKCSVLSSFASIPAGSCQTTGSSSAQCILTSTGGVWVDYINPSCTGTGTSAADSQNFTTGSCVSLSGLKKFGLGLYGRFSSPSSTPIAIPVPTPVPAPVSSPVSSPVTSTGYFGVAYYSDSKCATSPYIVQTYYASGNCIPYNLNYAKMNFDPTQTCSSSSSFFITMYLDSSCTIIYSPKSQVLLSKLGLTASSSECSSLNGLTKDGTIYGYGKLICSTTNIATVVSAPAYNLVTYAYYGLTTPVCGTNPFYFSSATTSCITIGGVSGQVLPVTLSNGLRGIDFFSYSGTSCQGQGTQLNFLNYVIGSCSQSSFTYGGGAYIVNVPTYTSKIKADTTIVISLTGLTSDNLQSSVYIQSLTAAIAKVYTVTGALETDASIISISSAVSPSFSPSLNPIVVKSNPPITVVSTNQPVIPVTVPTAKPIQSVSTNLCLPFPSSSCSGSYLNIRCTSCCLGGTTPSFKCVNGQNVCTCESLPSSISCDATCVATKERKKVLDATPLQLTFSLVSYFPANFDQSQIRSAFQNFPQISQSDVSSAIASRVPNVQVSSVQYSSIINLSIIKPTAQPINTPGTISPTTSGDSGGGSSPNTGLIVGATIGSVVGGLLLLLGCYLMYDNFYQKKSEDINKPTTMDEFTSPSHNSPKRQNEYSIRLDDRNVEFSLSRELREGVKRSSVKIHSPENREYSDQRKSRSPHLNNTEFHDDSEISVNEAEISVNEVEISVNEDINSPQKHDTNSNRKSMKRVDLL